MTAPFIKPSLSALLGPLAAIATPNIMLTLVALLPLLSAFLQDLRPVSEQERAAITQGFSEINRPCSYVITIERLAFRPTSPPDEAEPGGVLSQAFASEGYPWIPFESLDGDFTKLMDRQRSLRVGAEATSGASSEFLAEYQVVVSGDQQLMQCLSTDVYPARVRNAALELSYFARTRELRLTSTPSNTVLYSPEQLYQPLPINAASNTTLLAWNWSSVTDAAGVRLLRLTSPDSPGVRYSVTGLEEGENPPSACWLRTSEAQDSILFSAFSYKAASAGRKAAPRAILQVQLVGNQLNVERIALREFDDSITLEDARLWIKQPHAIFDARTKDVRRLTSITELPEEARSLIVIE